MPNLILAATGLLLSLLHRRDLALENLALRQQLAALRHAGHRPKLGKTDRGFWVLLCRYGRHGGKSCTW